MDKLHGLNSMYRRKYVNDNRCVILTIFQARDYDHRQYIEQSNIIYDSGDILCQGECVNVDILITVNNKAL